MIGTVVRVKDKHKGFVFIKSEDDGQDYFLHYSDLEGTRLDALTEGRTIVFEPETTPKGRRARQACVSS